MKKMNHHDYVKIKNLIQADSIAVPTFVNSVLDGVIDGIVYADSSVPETFFIGTGNGIYFAGGRPEGNLAEILNGIYRDRKNQSLRFTLFTSSSDWYHLINRHLNGEVKSMRRYQFAYIGGTDLSKKDTLPEGYSISQINPSLIERSEAFGPRYYEEYWGGTDPFIHNGFGFCLLHNGNIVSECTSIFASKHYAEIDIETMTEYQGKGLAKVLTARFISECDRRGLQPRWDCGVENGASIRLAERAGFRMENEYSILV
ncbi:GNAT family N-acetyltransferase [Bacillus sp. KH172YL63]|uniref:GNAT family N-acetyltransferase n=1 Tax=Bacillus sp. KH172YL63 TaxID=2709784 RepID=UPI0013E43423|nr:GNAT family N-acetyltransferase [Bacillus sp. KH172YL63]BCB02539.1 putative N-acetyltransferase YdfB [Bacillus sp. KH172YL63]